MSNAHHEDDEVLGKAYDGRLMRRLAVFVRPYWRRLLLAVALLLGAALAELAPPYLIRAAIDGPIAARDLAGITPIFALYVGALLLAFACRYGQTAIMQSIGQQVMVDIRMRIFSHIQSMSLSFFDRNPVGRLLTRLTNDVDALNEFLSQGMVALLGDSARLVLIVITMLLINWRLALVGFLMLPLVGLATSFFQRAMRAAFRAVRQRLARINAYLNEQITGILVTQLFSREERSRMRFDELSADYRAAQFRSLIAFAVFFPTVSFLAVAASALLLNLGGQIVLAGLATLGTLVAFIQYTDQAFQPIRQIAENYNTLQSAMVSSERIFRILDTQADVRDSAQPAELPQPVRGEIVFRDVWFRYPTTDDGPPTTDHRPPTTDDRPPTTDDGPPTTDHGRMNDDGRPTNDDRASVVDDGRRTTDDGRPTNDDRASVVDDGRRMNDDGRPTNDDRALAADDGRRTNDDGRPTNDDRALAADDGRRTNDDRAPAADDSDNPASAAWVLRGISLTIPAGQSVAVVGATGAGKTSLISLLARFYDVQRGAITLDGVDIRDVRQAELRRHIGAVPQDPTCFSGTIASNIRLHDESIGDEQVRRAAEVANAAPFIGRLPGGYGYEVRERGSNLSVGQRQLLAFARAIAFNPAVLLILDEATSSVDTETEALIQAALERLLHGRTSIVIAHRLSTIRHVDRIIVLHRGRVVEDGSHDELLARRGYYYRLYRRQFAEQVGA